MSSEITASDSIAGRPSRDLRSLYLRYACCLAFIEVKNDQGIGIGTAFHVGNGVFVTARHVMDNSIVTEIRITDADLYYKSDLYPKNEDGSYSVSNDSPRMTLDYGGKLSISDGPYFHPDPDVDIAVFRASGLGPDAHFVPLGGHLDDCIGSGDFELSKVLVLGYPPVPFTRKPVLLAVACDVNAAVDLNWPSRSELHFVLSGVPRGGFSGGVAISEWGFALGTVTKSLSSGLEAEVGFLVTTSIESIYVCLANAHLLPPCQVDWLDHPLFGDDAGSLI